jgi:hypothetical protein
MIDKVLREEFDDAFTAATEAFLGTASALAGLGEYPFAAVHSARFWNVFGDIREAAYRLWGVIDEYAGFGFAPPILEGADAAFRPLLDAALVAGRTYAKALALDAAHEGPGISDARDFREADAQASAALTALLDSVWTAFGVEEMAR